MADIVDRNHERIEKIKECAYSIITTIQNLTDFAGEINDLDDPFWGEISSIRGDLELMTEKLDEIE